MEIRRTLEKWLMRSRLDAAFKEIRKRVSSKTVEKWLMYSRLDGVYKKIRTRISSKDIPLLSTLENAYRQHMMKGGARHILGLAIDDSGAVATELYIQSGRAEVRAVGELSWEKDFTPDNAKELGGQLHRFLREGGFSANRVAIGLAAKWVLAKEIETPPATPEALAGMLSIQAERAFSLNADEMIFDYCGKAGTSQKNQVLLLAAPRQIVNQIKAITDAAGLRAQSVTVSALACGGASCDADPTYRLGLYARPTYCEFWGQSDGSPRFVKHVAIGQDGTPAGYADLLSSTIQRLVLLSSGQDQLPPYRIMAYDTCGLADDVLHRVNERLQPQITMHDGCAGVLAGGLECADPSQAIRSIAAIAVALPDVRGDRPAVDFLNSRLGAARRTGYKRAITWAAGIAAVCLIGLGILLLDWRSDRKDITAYTAQLKQMGPDIAVAREIVDRGSYARSWTSSDPRFLNCLRELTTAFPDEPSVWATSLALNESGTGLLVGKTTSESSFYEVLDKIKENKAFSDVKMIHIRYAGRDSREKEFAVNFKFESVK